MEKTGFGDGFKLPRRDFMFVVGGTVAGVTLGSVSSLGAAATPEASKWKKKSATVRGAFLYPSTESLKQEGYYSWPGSGFDAEGHQRQYMNEITKIAQKLDMRILMDENPLCAPASVDKFLNEIKQQRPDGLLLVPFKKSEWDSIIRIVDESGIPTVVLVTMGVLLGPQINQLHRRPGVYVICSLDNFDALEYGMKMIRTGQRMGESRIISLAGTESAETTVKHLGTQIRVLPWQRFADELKSLETTAEVSALVQAYKNNTKKIVEPSEADIVEAAKTYFACKRILEAEQGDAIMMDCLTGIRARQFPPPCMGFMSLRDESIPAGCQNDLAATLTMMLVQHLFDKPGFQQNASSETEKNRYFGAHCTCPTKLNGPSGPCEPYILRNHAEAGVGVVPQVLWPEGQAITMAHYFTGDSPQMAVYSGKVVRCYNTPPAGGCRTNVETTINEVDDVCDVKGMHQTIFFGDHAKQVRAFCQLFGIEIIT